ncbi:MAG: PH domain-containing protein [Schleiferiaceae bacterium]|nr:PH domain-containing protein [Schleiferiaceae bacterium]
MAATVNEEDHKEALFSNTRLDPAQLPRVEATELYRPESDYLYMRLTSLGLLALLVIGGLLPLALSQDWPWYFWLLPYLVVGGAAFFLEWRSFKERGYMLREQDITYRKGWLFQSVTSVPFNRLQHCEYSQGPLGKLFDLAAVKVFTAGGASSDVTVQGLSTERAQELRSYLTQISSGHA